MSRRAFGVGLGGAALAGLAGCGGTGATPAPSGAGATGAFALLPMTGEQAALGQDMARAMTLVATGPALPEIRDAGGTADTAGSAATAAMAEQARLILGPLRADQVPAVLAAVGDVPVLTFSNDESLAGSGAFIFGVTPAQSVATMFSFAKAQGALRVAIVAADQPYGRAAAAAGQALAAAGGMSLPAVLLRDPAKPDLAGDLRRASGGVMPDAVFLPDRGTVLAGFAQGLRGTGVQIMGGTQWALSDQAAMLANPDLDGAWFAAPDPQQFQTFAGRFQVAFGTTPGYVTALGHDAALLAVTLGSAGALSRNGLLRAAGFTGALGHFRFQADGRCTRDLSVLALDHGRLSALGEVTDT